VIRVVTSLLVVGMLGLVVAGVLLLHLPILKMSGPNAFEGIEQNYVDHARVDRDERSREEYAFLKRWIMHNEPYVLGMLGSARIVGITFALLVSAYCFGLAFYLRKPRA